MAMPPFFHRLNNKLTRPELDLTQNQLIKSNATHVHLHQVSLSSEATFKCEVSADSPSFATVSAERQMKIYGELALHSAYATGQAKPR